MRIRFADIPAEGVPPALIKLGQLGDMLGEWLEEIRGTVTDAGYNVPDGRTEMVVESPTGIRIEITMKITFGAP